MDHLLANSDNPIPSGSEQAEDVDSADEDSEELKMHIKKTGASEDPIANVSCYTGSREDVAAHRSSPSNAQSAARPSGRQPLPAFTQNGADIRSSKSQQKRSASLARAMTDGQIKPLTEEEKKAKLAELRQKLAEKRAAQAKVDAKENKANDVSLLPIFNGLMADFRPFDVKPDKTQERSKRI